MSEPVTVSAIIPVFNAVGTIREAVASVIQQSRTATELVIVDDASTDGTRELLCKEFAQHTLVFLDQNLGPAGARNAGIRKACGEWLAFLDGDDAWLPWRLAAQFEALRAFPDAALVCGQIGLLGAPDGVAAVWPAGSFASATRRVALEEFVDSNPVPTSTVLAKRAALLQAGGFDEQFRGPEDMDLWVRLAALGTVVKIEKPLTLYRERPGSLCMDPERFLPQILRVYEKAFGEGGALWPYRRFHRRASASRCVSAAWTCLESGWRWRALLLIFRSWLLWPGRLKIEQSHPFWRMAMARRCVLDRTR